VNATQKLYQVGQSLWPDNITTISRKTQALTAAD
jgi:hypothetical protein